MQKKYTIIDIETGQKWLWTIPEIVDEINRDRSNQWQDYTAADWREGLAEFCYPLKALDAE